MSANGSHPLPQIPELEEQYELLRELGRGGAVAVYLARERDLGRLVAIKLIDPSFGRDDEAAARLALEARAIARLRHPNIVMILGARRLASGDLALVLQYMPGTTLQRQIDERGPLPIANVESILRDLGRALAHAHAQRIVHRDVKPGNVFVDERVEVAQLADFGAARVSDFDGGPTLPGTTVGTPAYMSPEQVDGHDLDGRSDLYSLGVVGYEMLAGRHPWVGEDLSSLLSKQTNETFPSVTAVRPDVPRRIQRAIERALSKDPRDRWADADEFLSALKGRAAVAGARPMPEEPVSLDFFGCWDPVEPSPSHGSEEEPEEDRGSRMGRWMRGYGERIRILSPRMPEG